MFAQISIEFWVATNWQSQQNNKISYNKYIIVMHIQQFSDDDRDLYSSAPSNTNESPATSILRMAESIFHNIGCYRRIQDIQEFCKQHIYFEICKIMFPQKYMKMIQAIQAKGCSRSEKIQDLINLLAKIITDNLEHITGTEIVKGNIIHISNLLQVLEYFSEHMDAQHSLLNKKSHRSKDSRDYQNVEKHLILDRVGDLMNDKISSEQPYILPKGLASSSNSKKSTPSRSSDGFKKNKKLPNNKKQIINKRNLQDLPQEQSFDGFHEDSEYSELSDIRTGNIKEIKRMNKLTENIQRQKIQLQKDKNSKEEQILNGQIVNNIESHEIQHQKLMNYLNRRKQTTKIQQARLRVNQKEIARAGCRNVVKTNAIMRGDHLRKLQRQKNKIQQLVEKNWDKGEKILEYLKQLRQNSVIASSSLSRRSSDKNY